MEKLDHFKIVFPTMNITVRAARVPGVNERYFDWFCENLPIPETIWNAALIAGHNSYSSNLKMKVDFPYRYEDSDLNVWVDECKPGAITMWSGAGKNGSVIIKYGPDITEHMAYPIFAQVVDEDLGLLFEAGKLAWEATYITKDPVSTIRFEA